MGAKMVSTHNCRLIVIYSLFFLISFSLAGQRKVIDSLRRNLKIVQTDTGRINTLNLLSLKIRLFGKYDSALIYADTALALANKISYKKGIAEAYRNIGIVNEKHGNYSKALDYDNKSLAIHREMKNRLGEAGNLGNMGNVYLLMGNFAKALEYDSTAVAIGNEINDKNTVALNLGNIGYTYDLKGNQAKALEYDIKSLAMYRQLQDKNGIARLLGNIGNIYRNLGNYPKALEYDLKALTICQEINDKPGIARNLGNLGNIYYGQNEYDTALAYGFKALAIFQELKSKNDVALALGNIGVIYKDKHDYAKALDYNNRSLAISEELKDKNGIARTLGNIGNVYAAQKDYPKALEYNLKAISMLQEIKNKRGLAIDYCSMGNIYSKQKEYNKAGAYFDSALTLASSIGFKDIIQNTYSGLAKLDSLKGDYKASLADYKKYIVYKDSLVNDENTKKTVQEQMNYEFEQKQAIEKAEQDKKDAVAEQERNKQRVIRNSFIGGFALMLAIAFLIFRGYRQKQRANEVITRQKEEVEQQKHLVEQQKAIVEEKNRDILDSITYAKRLQDALLPPMGLIKQYLPESFVLYKPKDIVAGDFYWMERSGDTILLAAADCTGHGVPGALVSVVCSTALNRTVKEFKITDPGKILDKVRELVLETFEKSESNVQDGMDISLCCINTKRHEVKWSGAYNSLWYIQDGEMCEITADKQPIGKHDKQVPFSTSSLGLKKGDMLYLFTDGYADQFGGPKGKKFKYKQLSDKLKAISGKSMEEQKTILETEFENWRGNMEQTDDVCLIGVRIA